MPSPPAKVRWHMPIFLTSDPELLEPGPTFDVEGEELDPAQRGYTQVHNYAHYFWRPYLGNTAFALWELLLSFCYGEHDTAFPSISRLARMLTNSDHSRPTVTGRAPAPLSQSPHGRGVGGEGRVFPKSARRVQEQGKGF